MRYQELDLQAALCRRGDYAQACKELAMVLRGCYVLAPKSLQAALFQDVLLAFHHLSGLGTSQQVSAANLVLQAAEAVLPRQRKAQAVSSFKHAVVAQRRHCKNKEGGNGSLVLSVDVLIHIFSFLDVQSLAAAASVCRSWNMAARDEGLWHSQFLFHFGNLDLSDIDSRSMPVCGSSQNMSSVCWRKLFAYTQTDLPLRLFSSNRAYCTTCKSLLWLEDGMKGASPVCSLSRNLHHQLKPIEPVHILRYLLKERIASSSSSSSESDSEGDMARGMHNKFSKLWAYPRLKTTIGEQRRNT